MNISERTISDYLKCKQEAVSSGENELAELYQNDINVAQSVFDTVTCRELFLIYFLRCCPPGEFNRFYRLAEDYCKAYRSFLCVNGDITTCIAYFNRQAALREVVLG